MEFKLFGPGGSPSNHFQRDLKTLLDLDDEAWGNARGLVSNDCRF